MKPLAVVAIHSLPAFRMTSSGMTAVPQSDLASESPLPLDLINEPISTSTSGQQSGGGDAITGGESPTTGDGTNGTSGGTSGTSNGGLNDSSNGNQVAVLSTLDYSTDVSITNTQQITYNNISVVNVYGNSPGGSAGSPQAGSGSAAITRSRNGAGAAQVRLRSGRYFQGGRVDRIIGFDPGNGDQLALSTQVFRGIGRMDFTNVSSRRELRRASRTSADILYHQPSGQLFFNANGSARGYGSEGGLFAILEQSPSLSAEQFILM